MTIQPSQVDVNPAMPQRRGSVAESLAEGLFGFSETLQKIQHAADTAQADQVAAELSAGVRNTIKQKALETADPDQFAIDANNAIGNLRSTSLQALSPAVRQRVLSKTAGVFADANGDIQFTSGQKRIGLAQGSSKLFLEQKERELNDTIDEQQLAKIRSEIDQHFIDSARTNLYTPQQAMTIRQGMLERDAFIRAKRELDISKNPMADLAAIAQRYPNIDRLKVVNELNTVASARAKEIEELNRRAEKEVREANLAQDYLDAVEGKLNPVTFTATVRARRYTIDEANKLKAAMEEGGVTDDSVYTRLETEILQGKLRDQGAISVRRDLDRNARSNLMRLIESQIRQDRVESRQAESDKRGKHFTNAPEYQQAMRELRAHISGKGESTPLDDRENIRYNFILKQMYDRVGNEAKPEHPIAVAEELKARMPPKSESQMPIKLKYQNDKELIDAKRRGVPERIIAQEALLLLEWEKYNKETVTSATNPASRGGPVRPRQ